MERGEGRLDEQVEVGHERERLKMRVAVLEEGERSYEVECRASRETLMRLVAEVGRERRNAASRAEALESLRLELTSALAAKSSTEAENRSLSERLDASRRVVEVARQEAGCLERQVEDLDARVHASQGETEAACGRLRVLREKLWALLPGRPGEAPPTDGEILQGLSDLHARDEAAKNTAAEVEERLSRASEDAARQTELHHSAQQGARRAEQQVQDLRERLRGVEEELLAADAHRHGLSHSREHYERFLEQLSERMKVDAIAADLGFDMRLQLLLSRAEQLVKQEGAALAESKTLTHGLQRKLKAQRERLQSKELHAELLRKKVADLEEEKRSRSALGVERDDAHVAARRAQRKAERLQGELGSARLSNTELKAQLCHTNELKLRVLEQTEEVREQGRRLGQQGRRLGQLEEEKAGAETQLSAARSDLQDQERTSRDARLQLTTLRQSLAQLTERQRELVDFRSVVAQMVGLDAAALALPNYQIIKYLESLLQHSHHHHHLHHPQLHHHHHTLAWPCPAHQHPQVQDGPDRPSSAASQSSAAPEAPPLHGP